ncbi:MAG: trehalose-6-phosphate synthase [Acinetobacter populi]|jgi:trehalose 6-phosphate synthase|uniref:alpha,alpha-trehalose-phosphate synthase (UDP-forming) n=1 Tax=Acinetobacter populi TaxID=1582270 RepID=UPI00235206FB|nr:trehalose-6-phosphate synthase [Acinetobacter populi]MCH4246221.1 trehalose-6-phosphate synthase [Acinetobacter populi]
MSKLIVVSNRVSLPHPDQPSAGGLAVALHDALNEIGGVWLGWNGEQVDDGQLPAFDHIECDQVDYITCALQRSHYQKYYCGFANNTLWPAMHDRADLIRFKQDEYEAYQQVNYLFAQKLAQIAEPDDVIWIHDYHFFSMARYCRELGMQNKIGFFLHIPFAPADIWQVLPRATALIEDLHDYDVIGLQTENDQKNCMQVSTSLLKAMQINAHLISYKGHLTTIKCYPIGIHPDSIQELSVAAAPQALPMPNKKGTQKTIIGVDRIDYSKGLIQRFDALADFFNQYPRYQTQLTALQIACPCRLDIEAYQALHHALNQQVERINQQFSRDGWQPIDCRQEVIAHESLMRVYRAAQICWVTSLRDGMNLVAKEYIAAQNPLDPGVLILSKYAGAADQMSAALIVDPLDAVEMREALKTAMQMPKSERLQRYQQLIKGLYQYDINDWRNQFLWDLMHHHQLFEHCIKQPTHRAAHMVF